MVMVVKFAAVSEEERVEMMYEVVDEQGTSKKTKQVDHLQRLRKNDDIENGSTRTRNVLFEFNDVLLLA